LCYLHLIRVARRKKVFAILGYRPKVSKLLGLSADMFSLQACREFSFQRVSPGSYHLVSTNGDSSAVLTMRAVLAKYPWLGPSLRGLLGVVGPVGEALPLTAVVGDVRLPPLPSSCQVDTVSAYNHSTTYDVVLILKQANRGKAVAMYSMGTSVEVFTVRESQGLRWRRVLWHVFPGDLDGIRDDEYQVVVTRHLDGMAVAGVYAQSFLVSQFPALSASCVGELHESVHVLACVHRDKVISRGLVVTDHDCNVAGVHVSSVVTSRSPGKELDFSYVERLMQHYSKSLHPSVRGVKQLECLRDIVDGRPYSGSSVLNATQVTGTSFVQFSFPGELGVARAAVTKFSEVPGLFTVYTAQFTFEPCVTGWYCLDFGDASRFVDVVLVSGHDYVVHDRYYSGYSYCLMPPRSKVYMKLDYPGRFSTQVYAL